VQVHAFVFRRSDPARYSRYGIKVPCYGLQDDSAALLRRLITYAVGIEERPVVFPCGDSHALLLAEHAAQLAPYCLVWDLPHEKLAGIVNKEGLYAAASAAGVPTIASIAEPSEEELLVWSRQHPGPYILKPSYAGVGSCKLREKNRKVATRDELVNYVRAHGSRSLVVQRIMRGGDGNIFDTYGLCDRNGRVVCLASHRRIRQHPMDFGATSCGEIPAQLPLSQEALLFKATEKLFEKVRYHGIFGIEWLRDQATGRFYLIDFNARPFLTVGHLADCGVNLPFLAYRELCGDSLEDVDPRPVLPYKRWVFVGNDIESFRAADRCKSSTDMGPWLVSVATCRSFGYWSWRDPLPSLVALGQLCVRASRFLLRVMRSRLTGQPLEAPAADLT